MEKLFRIATDQFTLDWNQVGKRPPAVLPNAATVTGHFKVSSLDRNNRLSENCWKSLPSQLETNFEVEAGPALFEQMEYQLYLRGKNCTVDIQHRDPLIRRRLAQQENETVLHGAINFQGQIGRSRFTVLVNGHPAAEFEVEVFPTKIDYQTDYAEIVADIQRILTSLAYEYLRSTYQFGKSSKSEKPTRLEWLILLRQIVDDLEKSIRQIANQPKRQLVREPRTSRIENIRHIDSSIRSQVRRGLGHGRMVQTTVGPIREQLTERPPKSTLNTLEHRWLKRQLTEIQRTVAQVIVEQKKLEPSSREQTVQSELVQIERRLARMLTTEPLRAADGEVPQGFASLQLISAPGYREAYQLCLLLKTGLRLEGDALRLNVKDLNVLYEYWTFLAMLRIIREELGSPRDLSQFFKIQQNGISVRLANGHEQTVSFASSGDRKITLSYNRQFQDQETTLIPQKPDILISFSEKNWPRIQLVCDAKYRIDATPEYRRQYNSFGPPSDAINVLHRYRDAILEYDNRADRTEQPKRTIIQAAALFPFTETVAGEYRDSRLWKSIDKLGIGAIPALPSNLGYLTEWLTGAIRAGGWSLSDRVIPHTAEQTAINWRVAASQPVLVGVLSSQNAEQRLAWIKQNRIYYHRLPKNGRHRHFDVKQVALFSPKTLNPNGIAHVADVSGIEIKQRSEIPTPWPASGPHDRLFLVYQLDEISVLTPALTNTGDQSTSFRGDRWTTQLGLNRAQTANEIILETEPEWKLYESLKASNIEFTLSAGAIRTLNDTNPEGRAWFLFSDGIQVRFDGANGFLCKSKGKTKFIDHTQIPDLLRSLAKDV